MSDKTHTGPDLGSESSHFAPAHRVTMVCSSIVSAPISHHQTHEVTNDTAAYMQHVVGHACSFDLMRRVSVIPLATNAPIAVPTLPAQADFAGQEQRLAHLQRCLHACGNSMGAVLQLHHHAGLI